jgi:hypothetical protein
MKQRKPVPLFTSEQEEQAFWAVNDSADYVDWGGAQKNPSFSSLKPTSLTNHNHPHA